MYSKAWMNV
jgi:hypothetical protein